MAKFNIGVLRISYATKTLEVEADTLEEAQELALEKAGNFEFTEHSAEYELGD